MRPVAMLGLVRSYVGRSSGTFCNRGYVSEIRPLLQKKNIFIVEPFFFFLKQDLCCRNLLKLDPIAEQNFTTEPFFF